MFGGRWIATVAGLLLAGMFFLTLPDALLTTATLKVSEVHLASAGIIGTALALMLSFSIVPAQKAADVFSSAILKLYARDRTTLRVFALLSSAALASLLLGTGWTFSLSARYTLAGHSFCWARYSMRCGRSIAALSICSTSPPRSAW